MPLPGYGQTAPGPGSPGAPDMGHRPAATKLPSFERLVEETATTSVFEPPSLWEQFQTGEMASRTFFLAIYGILASIAALPLFLAILGMLAAGTYFVGQLFGVFAIKGPVVLGLLPTLFCVLVIGFVATSLIWSFVAGPFWHARLRYFHNHTLGVFSAATRQSGNADRYVSLMHVRRFLFSLPRTGRLFQARWKQNLALFMAYSTVHRLVRGSGRLPTEFRLTEEYSVVIRSLQEAYPELKEFQSGTMGELLTRIGNYYQSRGDSQGTLFPIGELFEALGNVRRTKIYPRWYGNRREDDLGTIIDGLFDRAVRAEDYRENHQLHQVHGFDFRELADEAIPRYLMHCEHPWVSRLTLMMFLQRL